MPERRYEVVDLTGKQKVAMLLISLGQEVSVKLLKLHERGGDRGSHPGDRQLQEGRPWTCRRRSCCEFYNLAMAQEYIVQGGVDYARHILQDALGDNRADEIIGPPVAASCASRPSTSSSTPTASSC